MKIFIAGLGSIGRRHFRNLLALGETDLVLLRTYRATLPDDALAGYPVETDLRTALQKHKPQAVIVANPTALHLEVALPAAEAGCTHWTGWIVYARLRRKAAAASWWVSSSATIRPSIRLAN